MDSDDEYDQFRKHGRNKFRNERDDFQSHDYKRSSYPPPPPPPYKSSRHDYDQYSSSSSYHKSRDKMNGQGYSSRYPSSRTPPPPPPMSSQRYPPNMPPHSNYYPGEYPPYPSNGSYKRPIPSGPSSSYDSPYKKPKRDWMDYEGMNAPVPPPSGYFEHDNRMGMNYDDYDEMSEYYEDYHGMPRPPGYSSGPYPPYPNGPMASMPPNNYNPMMMMKQMQQPMAPMPQYYNQMRGPNETGIMGQYPSMMMPQMNQPMMMSEFPTQPRMMTFREFLRTLSEDEIKNQTESYRLDKYNKYKEDFRAEQTQEFFDKHKNEDWFRLRYHPEDSYKRKLELKESIKNRLKIFNEMLLKYGQNISLEISNEQAKMNLSKFLDACMIRLEGGLDDSDLEILEKIYTEKCTDAKIPQKTQSIFFKHLPVYVTRHDLEKIGSKLEGYKRASISEPAPERGFQRRGWMTYNSQIDIKDTCAKLNGVRVNETSKFVLNATINRDLDQRVKLISGLSNHYKIVRQDLRTLIKVVGNMDKKWSLYEEETDENSLIQEAMGYLNEIEIDIKETKDANEIIPMEKDNKATELLDKLILYLRIVHSIDYYNASEYQQEDYMPYRCGVLHARASSEVKSDGQTVHVVNGSLINVYDPASIKMTQINEWLRLFENHIRSYSEYRDQVDLDLAKKLGLKDYQSEMEKFIRKNCQKVDKDVWLCPLSGKKFKGPDYVRKHIETKHEDKLNELKIEVEYFNKFVLDPKRPYLPEHPMNRNMGKMGGQMGFYDMGEYDMSYNYSGAGIAGPMPTYPMYNQFGMNQGGSYQAPGLSSRSSQHSSSSHRSRR
ncbi:unnamed protein product [Brachionus calyciflorus]|uniref:Arsenite-resistance protein 2 homolog n=1 Tax=Brachionus calyciflorus TaxID=104777 RepID=A0A813M498_9BILA|nr:unnamed protein product [Brachionus calyciflorus]